jgi:tetratricopeptide (TPR) repeat protein
MHGTAPVRWHRDQKNATSQGQPMRKPSIAVAFLLICGGFAAAQSAEPPAANSNDVASTTLENFKEGSRYYLQQNFRAAIGPYQKALDAEKQSPTLSKTLWRVLIDNLGMAYGMTGDLNRAEDTFNYGVSKDPTYPLFYYNLACVAAGRNDMDKTMQLLQSAFSYKANVIAGESMPDPRHDDSFQAFMSNQRFRDFVNGLLNEK